MEFEKLKNIATFTTGKLNSNAAEIDGQYPFFTCAHEIFRINNYSYDGEYVLLGGNNASGDFPIFYYNGKFDAYQRTYLIQPFDSNRYLTRYLYYAIGLRLSQMKGNAAGTATKFLTQSILNNLYIEKRLIDKQNKIISVLSAYDNLIDVNNKRIKTLGQMAENLYKEWFVRFRFPGHENAEFENGIPQGWSIKKLSEISTFTYGKMPDADRYIADGYPIFSGYRITGYYDSFLFEKPMLVLIARGVGGTGEVRISPPFAYITNLSIVFLLFNPELYLNYLYQLFSLQNLRYLDTGAAQSQITIDNLKNVRIVLPPDDLLVCYNSKDELIKKQIETLSQINTNLTKQRDLLLPRLMSGKLEV